MEQSELDKFFNNYCSFKLDIWWLKEKVKFPFVILINIIFGDISSSYNPIVLVIVGLEKFHICLFV